MDIFLTCKKYSGEIRNMEPHKCGGLAFFSPDEFPDEVIGYVKTAVENIGKNIAFSETYS
jgi:hypothetical protein